MADVNWIDQSIIGSCLEPLLKALNWTGTKRQFREALPHFTTIDTIPLFCRVMENLNYKAQSIKIELQNIDDRLLPCLFVAKNGSIFVVLEYQDGEYVIFDGKLKNKRRLTKEELATSELKGEAYTFKFISKEEYAESLKISWFRKVFLANRKFIYNALVLSFFLSLLMLATPLYIMGVYDRVVGADSIPMLQEFLVGILIAMIGYAVLYQMRSKILALIGSRMDKEIGNVIFERLLYLSPTYTESASVGSQVARIKDFDKLREFLSGPLLSVFFEVPFIFVSLVVIAILGGLLVIIPIVLILVFILLGLIFGPETRRRIANVSDKNAHQQEFIIETTRKLRPLKYLAVEDKWIERFRDLSAESAYANVKTTILGSFLNAVSDMLLIISGLSVISFGAIMVINGNLSVGGMIAIMILVWRTLGPLKVLFNTFPRMMQIFRSVQQIDRLMKIEPESQAREVLFLDERQLQGDIRFNRVSFRYQASLDAVLIAVNFKIKPGSLVGLVGRNGSGKSTLLKLILRLYQPQAGTILMNNHDIRQFNPIDLRNHIAYLPQTPELFYGTIAQNLRMAKPDASMEDLQEAVKHSGIYDDIIKMPQGFETPLRDFSSMRISSSFRQSLCLARAYLKKSSVILLDEPENVLDDEANDKLLETLEKLRGKVTVLMVTHRPSHLKIMDDLLLLESGQLLIQGAPSAVLQKIPKELL